MRPSLALWLKVLNILKCAQIRNMQALLEGGKIHILPLLEEHLGFIRDSNPVHDLLSCVGWRRIFCRYFLMHNFGGMAFLCKVLKQGRLVVLLTGL